MTYGAILELLISTISKAGAEHGDKSNLKPKFQTLGWTKPKTKINTTLVSSLECVELISTKRY